MNGFIPVDRLHETATLIAFYHPRPSHNVHILLVPKRIIPNMTLLNSEHCDFMTDVFATVKRLVDEFGLAEGGYSLVCNGGASQDVAQLHFHLIADGAVEKDSTI